MGVFILSSLVAEVLQKIIETEQVPSPGPLAALLGTDPSVVEGLQVMVARPLQRRIQDLGLIIPSVEGHDRQLIVLVEELEQCFGPLLVEWLGFDLPQLLLADFVELQGLLGAWMLGSVVVVEGLGLLAVLVEYHRDLERLVVLEAVGLCVDRVEVPIVELISFDEGSIGFGGLEVP